MTLGRWYRFCTGEVLEVYDRYGSLSASDGWCWMYRPVPWWKRLLLFRHKIYDPYTEKEMQ